MSSSTEDTPPHGDVMDGDPNMLESNSQTGEKRSRSPLLVDENGEDEADEAAPPKRFRIVPTKDQYKWALPSQMADYCNEHINTFFTKDDLDENIMTDNPVPENIQGVHSLDKMVGMSLNPQEKHLYSSLVKLQQNVTNIFGPLSRVWSQIEDVNKGDFVELSLSEIRSLVEKTVLMTSQAVNSEIYQRSYLF